MAAPKRTKVERIRDCALISELTLKGWGQQQIAQHLGLSQSQISRELTKIKQSWKKESNQDFDLSVKAELKRLELIERTFWEAWEKSLKPKESTSSEKRGSELKVGKRSEQRAGNPAYLKGVLDCIDRRCKLLGLDAPIKSEVNGALSLSQDYANMDADELSRLYLTKIQNPHQN